MAQADRELQMGDELQASEKLWGAVAHAIRSALPEAKTGKHSELRKAAKRLSDINNNPLIYYGFAVAEQFHANFYHGFMEDYEIESNRIIVHSLVNLILTDAPPIVGLVEQAPSIVP